MLVDQLPPESATATALRLHHEDDEVLAGAPGPPPDPEAEQWSRTEQLLAGLRDELLTLRWLYASAHSDRPLKWRPEPLPRPGVLNPFAKPKPAPQAISTLAAHLSRLQADDGEGTTTYN